MALIIKLERHKYYTRTGFCSITKPCFASKATGCKTEGCRTEDHLLLSHSNNKLNLLQGADLMIGKLTNTLRSPNVSLRQAADAIKHLLHLQAESARSTQSLNPVKLYLEAQVRHPMHVVVATKQTSLHRFFLLAHRRQLMAHAADVAVLQDVYKSANRQHAVGSQQCRMFACKVKKPIWHMQTACLASCTPLLIFLLLNLLLSCSCFSSCSCSFVAPAEAEQQSKVPVDVKTLSQETTALQQNKAFSDGNDQCSNVTCRLVMCIAYLPLLETNMLPP